MRLRRYVLVAFVFCCTSVAFADPQTSSPAASTTPPPPMKVTAVDAYSNRGGYCPSAELKRPCVAGIGDRLIVYVEGLEANVKDAKTPLNPRDFVLYLDKREFTDLKAVPYGENQLVFDLKRTEGSSQAWNALLAQPGLKSVVEKKVTVGFSGKAALPADENAVINLRVFYTGWTIVALIGVILALVLFIWLARTTGILRDSGPPLLTANKRPFSLARAQAAVWFFLVIGSFLFLYLITGDYNTVSEQALILIGIGTGTALGAAMIDASKNTGANESLADLNPKRAGFEAEVKELTAKRTDLNNRVTQAGANATPEDKQALSDLSVQLSQKTAELNETIKKIEEAKSGLSKPESEGLFRDLLSDVNGVNFHRFQMVIWTIVLVALFIAGVYSTLAMPQFSNTLLALMGISSGTYLGFKIPERQT